MRRSQHGTWKSHSNGQGRIYIHAEQGDLLVKTRRDVRVPAGKTVAITSCGKPGETVRLVTGSSLPYIAFGSAVTAGLIMPFVIPRDKQPISAGSPASVR